MKRFFSIIFLIFILLAMPPAVEQLSDLGARAERLALGREYNFVAWELQSLWLKWQHLTLGAPLWMDESAQRALLHDYETLIRDKQTRDADLTTLLAAAPEAQDPARKQEILRELADLRERRATLEPLFEAVVQTQVSAVLAASGLTLAGQPIPPVAFCISEMPFAIILSPRNQIRRETSFTVQPTLTLAERVAIEESITRQLDYSALSVPIGGLAIYPSMVMESSDLRWLYEVVSHEWIHHYLFLRPLGWRYFDDGQMMNINETTAELAGIELAQRLARLHLPQPAYDPGYSLARILRYERYLEQLAEQRANPKPRDPNQFDFVNEMRITRLNVDKMLAAGEIVRAEWYMEVRRRVFVAHGYTSLHKLNQAYFAFYGAYSASSESIGSAAAGEDVVGNAVRFLRNQHSVLGEFVSKIAWVWSLEDLQKINQSFH
ncbi:MAG: hypothetical protein OHK0052_11240 [Anaerolineales bacterium]